MSTIASPGDLAPIYGPQDLSRNVAPAGMAQEAGGALGAAEVMRIIKRHWLLIAIAWTVVYGMVVAGTYAVARWAPLYTAETVMELDPPRYAGDDPFSIDNRPVEPESIKLALETEARKIKAPEILNGVLAMPVVRETKFFKSYPDAAECREKLDEAINATPIPDTNLFRIRLSAGDPKEARDLLNSLTGFYWLKFREAALNHLTEQKNALQDQLTALEQKRAAQQAAISQFRASVNVPQLESQRNVIAEHIANIMNEITMYDANVAQLEGQAEAVRKTSEQLLMTPEIKIIIESDPVLRLYRQQAEALEVEIEVARKSFLGTNHRDLRSLEERRRRYVELETGKREELIDDMRNRERENIEQSLAMSRRVLLNLLNSLEEQEAKQRDMDQNYQKFVSMVEDERRITEQIGKVREAIDVVEHALRDKSRIRLKQPAGAEPPRVPSRPNWLVYLGGGFFLAAFVAFGLAFLREFTDTAIRTPIDVARHGRVSVLGSIPRLEDEETEIDQIEMAAKNAPQSLLAESFRQVRTNLLFSGPPEAQRSVLVTSPSPEDGKTSVAINLAVSFARSNQRVLLVDANFRKPAIRNTFTDARSEGLSNILVGQTALAEVVNKTDMPNLDVLTTGPMPPTPAELLGTRYMRELISEALTKYDRIIIDGPPVLLMSDALVLATQVDGVVLVTRAVTNSKGTVKRAREQLAKVGARVLGAILNSVVARPGGYFKRQYRDFYEYGSEVTIPRELPTPDDSPSDHKPNT